MNCSICCRISWGVDVLPAPPWAPRALWDCCCCWEGSTPAGGWATWLDWQDEGVEDEEPEPCGGEGRRATSSVTPMETRLVTIILSVPRMSAVSESMTVACAFGGDRVG